MARNVRYIMWTMSFFVGKSRPFIF
ncbi:uncharacterized protein G2W53_019579 [Senna tora]|uniref:Uncharacterized protein n=1 Tax=Senna tora TaxID=362788 RepID=A0A834TYB8_9FABA|nr:uncharacterized protein G2W53_019579 [Senna tora]